MDTKMVAIRIQLPEKLRAAFKARCALSSKSMNEVVVELIEHWVAENPGL
jgi:hypothetical protein